MTLCDACGRDIYEHLSACEREGGRGEKEGGDGGEGGKEGGREGVPVVLPALLPLPPPFLSFLYGPGP